MKKFTAALFLTSILSVAPASAAPDDDVKRVFDRFINAQNAHDVNAVQELLLDSPNFLWITRGAPVWGHDEALRRFEGLYKGTWHLDPKMSKLRIFTLTPDTAQLYVPIEFMIGPAGQTASPTRFLMNQTLVKTANGWRIAAILPIPAPAP